MTEDSSSTASVVAALRDEAARFYNSDASEAVRIAGRAVEVARASKDPVALGWGHRAMAEALLFSGRLAAADRSYEKAATAWRKARADRLLGQLLVGRTSVLALMGRFEESEAAGREARKLLETAGDQAYLAKLAMNLGNRRFREDRYGPALEEYDRAAANFESLGVRDASVIGLEINRGVALSQLDRDEEALDLFDRIEKECEEAGHHLLLAQTRMNAAYVHAMRADFDLALSELLRATAYFDRTDHPAFLAACRLNRAEIYHQLNLNVEALKLSELAIPLFADAGLGYDRGSALAQAGLSRLALGRTGEGIRCIRRARSLFAKESNQARVALMDLLLATALPHRGEAPEALRLAADASRAFASLGLTRWEAAAEVLRVRQERVTQKASAGALDGIARLRGLLRRVPEKLYPLSAYQILEALGEEQERAGDTRAAATTYRRAIDKLEDLRIRIPTEQSKISFLEDKSHLYDRLLALEMGRTRVSVDHIFEIMERSRAQAFWDRLRDPSAFLPPLQPVLASSADRRLHAMRRRLTWLHARLARLELGSTTERERISLLRRRLVAAEADWARALREHAEEEGGAADRAGSGFAEDRTPTLSEIGRLLPDGWGFVSYHIGSVSLALVISKDGAWVRRLADDAAPRLAALIERLDFQWGAAAMTGGPGTIGPLGTTGAARLLRSTADRILHDLYHLLWEPIEEAGVDPSLSWIVSPHGLVHRVPLHALRDRSGYLAERFDVAIVPSARIWNGLPRSATHLARVGVARHSRLNAWVGGVASSELPIVQEEIRMVSAHLPGWNVRQQFAATAAELKVHGSRAELIHIAAHGSLRSDNPAYSYIALADGPLFVHDLPGLRLPASTVVLSACSSGRGAAPAGEEWIGLARGFLGVGASTVVASLWPVGEASTLEVMDGFYESFGAGASAPRALGQAMRTALARRPHPWEWASFAVTGAV